LRRDSDVSPRGAARAARHRRALDWWPNFDRVPTLPEKLPVVAKKYLTHLSKPTPATCIYDDEWPCAAFI